MISLSQTLPVVGGYVNGNIAFGNRFVRAAPRGP